MSKRSRNKNNKKSLMDLLQDLEIDGLRYMSTNLPRNVMLFNTYRSFKDRYTKNHGGELDFVSHSDVLNYHRTEFQVLKRYTNMIKHKYS